MLENDCPQSCVYIKNEISSRKTGKESGRGVGRAAAEGGEPSKRVKLKIVPKLFKRHTLEMHKTTSNSC